MKYLSTQETADKWGISRRRIQLLCSEERIDGAVRVGGTWIIPDDAVKPKDARVKSGRYIKNRQETK